MTLELAVRALEAWDDQIRAVRVTPVQTGLINASYQVEAEDGSRYALQRLAPIFGREVNRDVAQVTNHLAGRGFCTPRLLAPKPGPPAVDIQLPGDGGVWRVLTWVEGDCLQRLDGAPRAREAGRLLARFHAALNDFGQEFFHRRLNVHDTAGHLQKLASVLEEAPRAQSHLTSVGHSVGRLGIRLPALQVAPPRVVHGDPKVSNLIFGSDGSGRALVDLDTVGRMPLAEELGDAFRSWCNPFPEDAPEPRFDLELFRAALEGYVDCADPEIRPEERRSLIAGTRRVVVGLAARFARDAVEDRYFGWDPERYPSRQAHNLARAQSQTALALDLESKSEAAERIVDELLGP